MEAETKIFASESSRWYEVTTDPGPFGGDVVMARCVTEVEGKNGKRRAPTLADARPRNLFPSTTSIQGTLAKPGIVNYSKTQLLMAALTLPRRKEESDEKFIARIIADADADRDEAARIGKLMHSDLAENLLEPRYVPERESSQRMIQAVRPWLVELGAFNIKPELSFASLQHGFAGQVDLPFETPDGMVIADHKTRDFTKKDGKKIYTEQIEQIAGYTMGLGLHIGLKALPRWFSVLTDRATGETVFVEHNEEKKIQALHVFDHTLAIWQERRSYRPHLNIKGVA